MGLFEPRGWEQFSQGVFGCWSRGTATALVFLLLVGCSPFGPGPVPSGPPPLDLTGHWVGSYAATCIASSDEAESVCRTLLPISDAYPVELTLTRTAGLPYDAVLELGYLSLSGRGRPSYAQGVSLGTLEFEVSNVPAVVAGRNVFVTVQDWLTSVERLYGAERERQGREYGTEMTGGWRLLFAMANEPGEVPVTSTTVQFEIAAQLHSMTLMQ